MDWVTHALGLIHAHSNCSCLQFAARFRHSPSIRAGLWGIVNMQLAGDRAAPRREEGGKREGRGSNKSHSSQDNHYNIQTMSLHKYEHSTSLFASFAFDPFDVMTVGATLTLIRCPTPDTHRWQVNTALQLNCECTSARLPHCRIGGLSSSPGISAEQAVFNELDLRSFN